MNPAERFFCALESRSNKEFIYGTAPRVRSWLLVEYPPVWRAEAIRESDLACDVRERLGSPARGSRCLFIRQAHDAVAPWRCYGVSSTETNPELRRYIFSDYNDVSLQAALDSEVVKEPLFAVCTHGNHDKCCSKFGLPTYDLLRQSSGDSVWQCSHIGGDRFAANMVCFPHGIYYGHVSLDDAPKITEAYRKGNIVLKNYRGRCCYTRCEQIAEYFVRSESGLLGLDELSLVSSTGTSAEFRSADGLHEVEFREKAGLRQVLTCKSTDANAVSQYELMRYSFRK